MAAKNVIKRTTGLTGLKVCSNPKHVLGLLYGKLLRTLHQFPPESQYRCHTEKIVTERVTMLDKCKTGTSHEIEEAVQCGQVEELIIQAENELYLARNMLKWKPWEVLSTQPPPDLWKWPPNKN